MKADDLVPIAEAAAKAGVTDRTLRRWAGAGRLTLYRKGGASGPGGRNDGPQVFVDVGELERLRQAREQIRPVKKT